MFLGTLWRVWNGSSVSGVTNMFQKVKRTSGPFFFWGGGVVMVQFRAAPVFSMKYSVLVRTQEF